MKIEIPEKTTKSAVVCGKTYWIGPVKARYMIAAQRQGGTEAGSVELGFRTLAQALRDSMGTEALTYEELIDLPISETQELMTLLNEDQNQ